MSEYILFKGGTKSFVLISCHFILQAVAIMLEWLRQHKDNPYPNDDEKAMLIKQTGLTINQINYWFTNARRRILPKWAQQCKWDSNLPLIAQTPAVSGRRQYISPYSAWGYCPRGVTLTAAAKPRSQARAGRDISIYKQHSGIFESKCVHCPWQFLVSALYTNILRVLVYYGDVQEVLEPHFAMHLSCISQLWFWLVL